MAQSDDQWWENQLHPTRKGFTRLATKAFVPELNKINLFQVLPG